MVRYTVKNVPVTLLLTRHNDESRPHRGEARQYLAQLDRLMDEFAPDQVIACNGHPMILEAMARARSRGDDDGVRGQRLWLLRPALLRTTSITPSRAASS